MITWENLSRTIKRPLLKNCRDFIIVYDIEGIEAGMPLCEHNDQWCPYKRGIFKPRNSVEEGGYIWYKGTKYVVCGHATEEDCVR